MTEGEYARCRDAGCYIGNSEFTVNIMYDNVCTGEGGGGGEGTYININEINIFDRFFSSERGEVNYFFISIHIMIECCSMILEEMN